MCSATPRACPRESGGSLPGLGEEHGASGAAIRAGQPADCGESTDLLRRAQCAQILPRCHRWACKVRYEAPLGRNEGQEHPENGPGAENPPKLHRQPPEKPKPSLFRVSLDLMADVEELLRTWVAESVPDSPDILDDPGNVETCRIWESEGAL